MSAARPVLIVDDDPSYSYALQRSLEAAGVAATTTCSAYDALRMIEAGEEFRLLSLDVRMGAGQPNGFALGRMVHAKRSGLPILYLSAFDVDDSEVETALGPIVRKSLGMDAAVAAIAKAIGP